MITCKEFSTTEVVTYKAVCDVSHNLVGNYRTKPKRIYGIKMLDCLQNCLLSRHHPVEVMWNIN